jgi:dimethylsulfoniopropionate demethylase
MTDRPTTPTPSAAGPKEDGQAGPTTSRPVLTVARRIHGTIYSSRVEAQGVKSYTVYNHTLLATSFRSLEEDYWHLKQHVQIWDVSCERQVEIRGPDAARLVQLMTPRDLTRAATGQCLYAPLVDESGGMINDPVVLKHSEDHYWLSIADSDVLLWAKGLACGFGLDVSVEQPEVWPLAVQGPKAEDLMARIFGEEVRPIRFFRFGTLTFRDQPLVVARSGFSKQGGFEIFVGEPELGLALWDALMESGQGLNVGPGCPNVIERIEGGLLSYGNDMTRGDTPLECGLDRYCALEAPIEFIGRDALRREARGDVRRLIRGVRLYGEALPACVTPWPVRADGRDIGLVTSAANSPTFNCGVGIAMLDRGHWRPGEEVTVEVPDGVRPATVEDLPFAMASS